jgi:hypothetical protein
VWLREILLPSLRQMDAEFVVMLIQLWAGRKNGRDTRAEGVSFPAVVDSRTVPCQIRSECIKRPPYWDRPVLLHEVSDNAISVWIWVDVEPDARQSLQGKRETETDYSNADELARCWSPKPSFPVRREM